MLNSYELLQKLGFNPVLLGDFPSGKPLHLKGFLKAYKKLVTQNILFLNNISKTVPLIALDPALGLSFRDEYSEYGNPDFKIVLLQEFLHQHLDKFKQPTYHPGSYQLLNHCHESAMLPNSEHLWVSLFEKCGLKLTGIPTSCCGMAGSFGHESKNQDASREIYNQSWGPHVKQYRKSLLVTGYSCKSQVERFDHFSPRHPVEILNAVMGEPD